MKNTASFFLLAILAIIALGYTTRTARASVIFSASPYTENFNGHLDSAASPFQGGTPVPRAKAAIPGGISGSSGWEGEKIAGTGTTNMPWTVDDGASNTGGLYDYGITNAADRALGALASGGNTAAFGVELVNNTGATVNSVSISYTGEYWRSSIPSTSGGNAPQNSLTFAYAVGASGLATYLGDAVGTNGLTAFPALNLVGPASVPFGTTPLSLDGNAAGNHQTFSGTLTNLAWAQGTSLYIRWQDTDDAGNDAGLAVDDFSLAVVPEPSALVLGSLSLLGLLGLKRPPLENQFIQSQITITLWHRCQRVIFLRILILLCRRSRFLAKINRQL